MSVDRIRRFYRWSAPIYDLTRPWFLYGRRELIGELPVDGARRILEVGCGTGVNLNQLARRISPAHCELIGLDLSREMLSRARRRLASPPTGVEISLIEGVADRNGIAGLAGEVDGIYFSYSLSMFREPELVISALARRLRPGGWIAAVDFESCRWPLLERWFRLHDVEVNDGRFRRLRECFGSRSIHESQAPLDLWRYCRWISAPTPRNEKGATTHFRRDAS